jgi:DNA-binding transcriptional regulator LsrR (DeoR family)
MGIYYLETKTRQQVAEEYGISAKTLNRRLKKANISLNPGIIFPNSLERIYNSFGIPEKAIKSNKVQ